MMTIVSENIATFAQIYSKRQFMIMEGTMTALAVCCIIMALVRCIIHPFHHVPYPIPCIVANIHQALAARSLMALPRHMTRRAFFVLSPKSAAAGETYLYYI